MEDAQFEFVAQKEENTAPLIACFQALPPQHVLNNSDNAGINFKLLTSTKTTKKKRDETGDKPQSQNKILVGETKNFQYAGSNFGSNADQEANLKKYAVGVFDKNKKKIRIIEVPYVYTLKQGIKSLQEQERQQQEEKQGYRAQKLQLLDTFGSKDSKKMYTEREKFAFDMDKVGGRNFKETDTEIANKEENKVSKNKYPLDFVDTSTTKVDQVYPLEELLPTALSNTIETSEFLELAANEFRGVSDDFDRHTRYERRQGTALAASKLPESQKVDKAKQIIYISWCISFLNKAPKQTTTTFFDEFKKLYQVPDLVMSDFMNKYYTSKKDMYYQEVHKMEELAYRIAALALHIESFSLNPNELVESLVIGPRIRDIFVQLGCKKGQRKNSFQLIPPVKLSDKLHRSLVKNTKVLAKKHFGQ